MSTKKIKIATVGCSHSSYYAGNPWPIYLKDLLNCDLDMAYSSGAGNEMNIEKVKLLLDKTPSLLIVQLTDPARLTMPIANFDNHNPWPSKPLSDKTSLTNSHHIEENCYYTFNPHENEKNLYKLINKKVTVDKFIIDHVLTSNHNLYNKVLHTMCAMAFMANQKNIPIVFFSWVVDIYEIISEIRYNDIFEHIHIIPGYVEKFTKESKIDPIPFGEPGAGHYDENAHKKICEEFIFPYLKNNNLI